MTIDICPHRGPRSFPTQPWDVNPSYSHRDAGDGVCDINPGTAHTHKQSNVNPYREYFKISGSHCRRFDLPEPSDVSWDLGASLWPTHYRPATTSSLNSLMPTAYRVVLKNPKRSSLLRLSRLNMHPAKKIQNHEIIFFFEFENVTFI